jgi:hypothetical protein
MRLAIIVGLAVAAALLGWQMRGILPQESKHVCSGEDALFHDPRFVVTGFTMDVATRCITSLKVRTR